MKRFHSFATVGLVLLVAVPASATPDILTQDIVVDVTGDTLHIDITAHVSLDGPLPIYGLVAEAVSVEAGGQPATLEVDPDPQYLGLVQWVTPADGVSGDVDVHIVLDGAPECASRYQPGYDACTFTANEVALLPQEPGASFYLTNLFATDPFEGSVTVHAPAGFYVVASQGHEATSDALADGSVSKRFDVVVPTDYLGVLARNVTTVSATSQPSSESGLAAKTVIAGVPAGAEAAMQRVVDAGARVLAHYEEWYGPLPVDEIHYMPVSGRFPFGGEGLMSDIFLGDFVTFPEFDYIIEQGAAHELGHSWWGGMTSGVDADTAGFLQEAFAEYSAWRALGFDDDKVRTAGSRMNAVWYMTQIGADDRPILASGDDQNAYVLVTYHKGSTFLRTLEERVGVDAWTQALRALAARGPAQLTVEALHDEVLAASGQDIATDIDQWLRRPGYPTLTTSFDGANLSIEASDDFDIDVPVHAISADGSASDVVVHAGASVALPASTVLVEVDPRWTLVRKVAPAVHGDVSLDGRVDAVDLMEVALHPGAIPPARRMDGSYDPLFDVDGNGVVNAHDVDAVLN